MMADPVVIQRHGTAAPTTANLADKQLGYDSAADILYIRDGAGIIALGGASFVPYTGATGAVNLGAFGITAASFTIGANTLDTTEWAYLDGQDQAVKTTSSPTFVTVNASSRTVSYQINGTTFMHNSGRTGDLFVGLLAGNVSVSGSGAANVGLGWYALNSLTTSSGNVAIGQDALRRHTTGDSGTGNNVALGGGALAYCTTGYNNFGMGDGSFGGAAATGVYRNVGIGKGSGKNAGASANSNVYIGDSSGFTATGSQNTFIGASSGLSSTSTSSVMIGFQAGYYETGAGKLFIDNQKRTNEADGRVKALVYGVFNGAVANQSITFNVGTATITGKLNTGPVTIQAGTGAAGTAPLKFTEGTNLAIPEAGAVEYDGKSFSITATNQRRNLTRTSDPVTSTVTATTEANTVLWTGTINANALYVGKILSVRGFGVMNNASAAAIVTFTIKLNGTTLATIATPGSKLTDEPWHLMATITTRATGVTGAVSTFVEIHVSTSADFVSETIVVDTTAANSITLNCTWSAENADNWVKLTQGWLTVEH